MALVVAATTQASSTSSGSSISSGGPRPPASGAVPPSIMAGIARPTAGPSTHTPVPHVATLSSSSSSSPAATVAIATLGTSASSSSSSGSSSFPEDSDWVELGPGSSVFSSIYWDSVFICLPNVPEEDFIPTDVAAFYRFVGLKTGVEQLAGYDVMEFVKKLNSLNTERDSILESLFYRLSGCEEEDPMGTLNSLLQANQTQLYKLNFEVLMNKVKKEYSLLKTLLSSVSRGNIEYNLIKNYCEKLKKQWNSSYFLFCFLNKTNSWVKSILYTVNEIYKADKNLTHEPENDIVINHLNKINQLKIESIRVVDDFDYRSFVEITPQEIQDALQKLRKDRDFLQAQLDNSFFAVKIRLAQRLHDNIIEAFNKEIREASLIATLTDPSKSSESEAYEIGRYSQRIKNFTLSTETTDSLYEAYLKMKKFLEETGAELASKHPTLTEHQSLIARMQSSLQENFTAHQTSLTSARSRLKKQYKIKDEDFLVAITPTRLSPLFNKLHPLR